MSAKAKHWLSRVAALPCVMRTLGFAGCEGRITVHHIREGQGAAQRAQDTLTVPLCEAHHQGQNGLHGLGRKGFYTRYKLDELDLLAATIKALA